MVGSGLSKNAYHTCGENRPNLGFSDTPSHQLIKMPATDDKRAFDHLAKDLAEFFLAFGILQRVKARLKHVAKQDQLKGSRLILDRDVQHLLQL